MAELNWEEIDAIEGWLTQREATLLFDLAKDMPDNTVWCEIGSWKGRSTVTLAQSGRPGIAIDTFTGTPGEHPRGTDTWKEYCENIKKYTKNICTLPVASYQARRLQDWSGVKIGLLFIDGEHTYEAIKSDFDLYWENVVPGGYVVLHDVWGWEGSRIDLPYPGVTRFGEELIKKYGEYKSVDRILVVRKQ